MHTNLAAAQALTVESVAHNGASKTHNHTKSAKTPKSGTHDKTDLKKVSGFDLCSAYLQNIGGPNYDSNGAFSLPVWAGACTVSFKRVSFIYTYEAAIPSRQTSLVRSFQIYIHTHIYYTCRTRMSSRLILWVA